MSRVRYGLVDHPFRKKKTNERGDAYSKGHHHNPFIPGMMRL
jgi:hypothetical protein